MFARETSKSLDVRGLHIGMSGASLLTASAQVARSCEQISLLNPEDFINALWTAQVQAFKSKSKVGPNTVDEVLNSVAGFEGTTVRLPRLPTPGWADRYHEIKFYDLYERIKFYVRGHDEFIVCNHFSYFDIGAEVGNLAGLRGNIVLFLGKNGLQDLTFSLPIKADLAKDLLGAWATKYGVSWSDVPSPECGTHITDVIDRQKPNTHWVVSDSHGHELILSCSPSIYGADVRLMLSKSARSDLAVESKSRYERLSKLIEKKIKEKKDLERKEL
jgi:hypothetical protein